LLGTYGDVPSRDTPYNVRMLCNLAIKLARAVYYMLKRKTAFDMETFLRT